MTNSAPISTRTPEELKLGIAEFLAHEAQRHPDTRALNPGGYEPWRWPKHPISADFHLSPAAWHKGADLVWNGHSFPLEIAETEYGVFGRSTVLRTETKGGTVDSMLTSMQQTIRPLMERWRSIAAILECPPVHGAAYPAMIQADGAPDLYSGSLRDLDWVDLLKLFFAPSRTIAHDAAMEIEATASLPKFGPAFIEMLKSETHPQRRCAQWLVLDLFEELPVIFPDSEGQKEAIDAMRSMMENASDDYARAVYKAGVVLGGHVLTEEAADTVIDLIKAPSRIARRSALHAVFHTAEWMPHRKDEILENVRWAAANDPEPLLREFAQSQARDIENGETDHVTEPVFSDEL